MSAYIPEQWLESTIHCVKQYAEERFDKALSSNGDSVGLQAYEIVMEFPGPDLDQRVMPFQRTIIHFEIDDIVSQVVGLGDNVFQWDEAADTDFLIPREAMVHRILWDVGIWSTDASGGTTSRARAKQILMNAFGGAGGITRLREFTDGGDGCLEILRFSGGRFIGDRVNDIGVYRMVESELEIRVFSRSPLEDTELVPGVIEIVVDPDLSIQNGTVIPLVELPVTLEPPE